MKNYEKAKYSLEEKAIEIARDLRKMEEIMDRERKVNIYLMRKYYDDLTEEFSAELDESNIDYMDEESFKEAIARFNESSKILRLYDLIAKKMDEEMPYPTYDYLALKSEEKERR